MSSYLDAAYMRARASREAPVEPKNPVDVFLEMVRDGRITSANFDITFDEHSGACGAFTFTGRYGPKRNPMEEVDYADLERRVVALQLLAERSGEPIFTAQQGSPTGRLVPKADLVPKIDFELTSKPVKMSPPKLYVSCDECGSRNVTPQGTNFHCLSCRHAWRIPSAMELRDLLPTFDEEAEGGLKEGEVNVVGAQTGRIRCDRPNEANKPKTRDDFDFHGFTPPQIRKPSREEACRRFNEFLKGVNRHVLTDRVVTQIAPEQLESARRNLQGPSADVTTPPKAEAKPPCECGRGNDYPIHADYCPLNKE